MTSNLLSLLWTQTWQIAVLAILVAVVSRFVAKNRPHLAHAMWILVLIKCVTPPLWGHSLGVFSQLQTLVEDDIEDTPATSKTTEALFAAPIVEPEPLVVDVYENVEPENEPLPEFVESIWPQHEITLAEEPPVDASAEFVAASFPIELAASTVSEIEIAPSPWARRLLMALTMGAILTLLITVVRCVRCLRLIHRHRTTEFDDALNERLQQIAKTLRMRRIPRIIVSDVLFGPAVLGLLRHTIVLPSCLLEKSTAPNLLVPRLQPRNTLLWRLLPPVPTLEAGASGQCVPGQEPWNEAADSVASLSGTSRLSALHSPLSSLDPILAHELLHIRRGDLRFGMLQVIAQSLWWFHPAVWFANRWLSREAERCCDEQVIAELGCSPSQYARSLLAVIESKHTLQPIPVFPGMKPVEITTQRMERIMSLKTGLNKRTPLWCWLAMAGLAIVVLPGAVAKSLPEETAQIADAIVADEASTPALPADQNAASAEMQLPATETTDPLTVPELPVPQFIRESSDPLVKMAWDAREVSRKRLLMADQQTPWQVMNGLMALRKDFVFRDGDKVVNALEWIQSNPQFVGTPWFQKTEHGGQPNPTPAPVYFDDHAQQFVAALAMNDLPLEATFPTADGQITMNDMIRHLQMQMTNSQKNLSPWTLYALAHYLPLDAKWDNTKGESWSIERLVQSTMGNSQKSLGAIDLFAVAYARNQYEKTGQPLQGVWLDADERIRNVATRNDNNHDFALAYFERFRLPHRTFEWHEPHALASASPAERLELLEAKKRILRRNPVVAYSEDVRKSQSRESLLFDLMAFSDDQLKDKQIRYSVVSAANDLLVHWNEARTQPPFHESVLAMSLYLDRVAAMTPDGNTAKELNKRFFGVTVKGMVKKAGSSGYPVGSEVRVLNVIQNAGGATDNEANSVFVIRNRRDLLGASIIQLSLDGLERGVDPNIHIVKGDEVVLENDSLFKQPIAADIHLADSFVLSSDVPFEMSDVVVTIAGSPITVASLLDDSVAEFMLKQIPELTEKQRRSLFVDTIKTHLPTFVFDDALRQYFHIEIAKHLLDERAVALAARDEDVLKTIREKRMIGVAISDDELKSLATEVGKLRTAHPATKGILSQTSLHTIVSPYAAGLPKEIADQKTVVRDHCLQLLIHAELRKTITLDLEGITLQDFLRELSRKNTLNVVLKTSAVESAGLASPSNAITYNCQNLPLKDAINAIIEPMGLDLRVEHDALCIRISDQEKFWSHGRNISSPSYCVFGLVKNHGWHVLDKENHLRDVIELEDSSMDPDGIHVAIANPDIRAGKANPVSMSLRLLLDDSTGKLNRIVNDGDIITVMTSEDAATNNAQSANVVESEREKQMAADNGKVPEKQVYAAESLPPAGVQRQGGMNRESASRNARHGGVSRDSDVQSKVVNTASRDDATSEASKYTRLVGRDNVKVVAQDDEAEAEPNAAVAPRLVVCTYPVADLLIPVPPTFNAVAAQRGIKDSATERATAENPSGDLETLRANSAQAEKLPAQLSKADFAPLVELIKASVKPESWGSTWVIAEEMNTLSLVVRQTDQAHGEIGELLSKLRKGRDQNVQITSLLVELTTEEQLKVIEEHNTLHSLGKGMKWSLLTPKRSESLTKALLDQKPDVISNPRIMTISGQSATVMVGSMDKSVFSGFKMTVTPQLVPDSSIIRLQHQISIGSDRPSDPATDTKISIDSFALLANQDINKPGSAMHESLVGSGQTLLLLIERPAANNETKSVDRYVLLLTPEHIQVEVLEDRVTKSDKQ